MRELETRDSLREEISQNLNENLAEHEVVTWTVVQPQGDTLKVERVTDRTRESGSKFNVQGSKVVVKTETVRDTVYIERTDTVLVQEFKGSRVQGDSLNPKPSPLNYLKWIFWILIGLIGLIITAKVCLRKW